MRNKDVLVFWGFCSFVFTSVYMIFRRDKLFKSNSKKKACPGLVNLGNTCFLNCLLQALSPCTSIIHWFELTFRNGYNLKNSLSIDLYSAFKVLNRESADCEDQYNPRNIFNTLYSKGWEIPRGEQDAYELFHVLMETLHEEKSDDFSIVSLFDGTSLLSSTNLPDNEGTNKFRTSLPKLLFIPPFPFHGKLQNQLVCKRCSHRFPVKYEGFDSLSVPFTSRFYEGVVSLESLLSQYVTSENIEGMKCEACAIKTNFLKKMVLGKLPSTLCIHIQRTVWTAYGPIKRTDHVMFPDYLDMFPYTSVQHYESNLTLFVNHTKDVQKLLGGKSVDNRKKGDSVIEIKKSSRSPGIRSPYSSNVNMLKALNFYYHIMISGLQHISSPPCLNEASNKTEKDTTSSQLELLARAYHKDTSCNGIKTNKLYRLASVIVHLGEAASGHFVTYKRSPSRNGIRFPNKWIFTSDTLVRPASSPEVFSSNAYMLLYEKV